MSSFLQNFKIKCHLTSQIDITQLLEPQGPFDVIVHKLSDLVVEAERDSRSQQLLDNFQVGFFLHICKLSKTNVFLGALSSIRHIPEVRFSSS